MTPETVFAKSAKGIQEIETRAHKLGSRLRQALILVDGIKTVDELVTDGLVMVDDVEIIKYVSRYDDPSQET